MLDPTKFSSKIFGAPVVSCLSLNTCVLVCEKYLFVDFYVAIKLVEGEAAGWGVIIKLSSYLR